jgi:adenine deaminase
MKVQINGNLVDILAKKIYPASLMVKDGKIHAIEKLAAGNAGGIEPKNGLPFICPGFIDSHVHIESSMLIPSEFARLAVVHGTVATVSDPHEIANVCGIEGVEFMIRNGTSTNFKFFFGAPSCVPATEFETAGARLDSNAVRELLNRKEILYLSEMMNFPGVLNKDPEVLKKIETAKELHKPIDGHAPGLSGEEARQYIAAGISTDHECFSFEEAAFKLKNGMKVLVREGSAARNFEALILLLKDFPDMIMFCSDDKHPDSLVEGHINSLCKRAVAKGIDVFNVLRAACINPVLHYGLEVGMLRAGDPADFILLKDLSDFEVVETYIRGELVSRDGKSHLSSKSETAINQFNAKTISVADLELISTSGKEVQVIQALDGQLITNRIMAGNIKGADLNRDFLKIAVVNRYRDAPVSRGWINGFGLKQGAIASSVAHDSHNIVGVGTTDEDLCRAINLIIRERGGVSSVRGTESFVIPLPVGGLMSLDNGYEVARAYTQIDSLAKSMGTTLAAPFMTLSFMALLVIPHLKMSDLGLFDGDKFAMIEPAGLS